MEKKKFSGGSSLPFKLLLTCPAGLSVSQVSVDFKESYDRIPHPDIELENSVSKIWDQRVQNNASLYNGKKFRYEGYSLKHIDGTEKLLHVCLHLGLTDYRTFVGTNLNPEWEKFLEPSEDDSVQCQHTSSPLGNGAIVETFDGKIVVLQRSHNVGEFPGHFVFPGGHPEPEEIGVSTYNHTMDSELVYKKLSKEMFDSIIREVIEEIGVPSGSLSSPLFIGMSRRIMNVRPAAFFFIKCNLRSEEIKELYSSAQDGFESTELLTVTMAEVEIMTSKMPGCHQGGFALYKMMAGTLKNA